jgi:thiol-disulfide isomerase/thioredoxin
MGKFISKFFFVLLISSVCVNTGYSQGYRIETTVKGMKDTTFIVGHFNGNRSQFIPKDTARADANGHMVFEGSRELPGGLYVVLFPGNGRWIEFIYSGKEPRFSLSTDTTDVIGNMHVKGSKENDLFYFYQNQLISREKAIEAFQAQKNEAKVRELRDEFKLFRNKFLKDNAATFTVKLLKMSSEPEIPTAPKLPNGKTDSIWVFNYYKAHYWDNFDFSDSRILRTPFLEPRLDRYIKNLVVQTPDSLIKNADWIIKKASVNEDIKTFVVFYIASQYENPKTVGTEGLWVHLAEKYYLSGQMGVAEESKKRISNKVNTLKNLLVNKPFPPLALPDLNGKKVSVQSITANYTILFFYAPTCGHCKEASPILKSFYDKNKADGVKVMTISTEHNMEEWKSFVKTYHLEEMVNTFDALNEVDFNRKFDVVTTPMIYVLDKNKKIIARKMPVEQLDDFLNYYKNKQIKKL